MVRCGKIERLRKRYPAGTRIELIRMYDSQSPPVGTAGIVTYVDDIGTIHVDWDNGSSLGLIPGVDKFRIVK